MGKCKDCEHIVHGLINWCSLPLGKCPKEVPSTTKASRSIPECKHPECNKEALYLYFTEQLDAVVYCLEHYQLKKEKPE